MREVRMNRIRETFSKLKERGQKALIPYLTAGFPDTESTLALMHALVASGANVIELGVPFSDPMADGVTIQRASEEALKNNVGLSEVFKTVKHFRETNRSTPIVLMGYANPVERYNQLHGNSAFATDAALSGVDGILLVDYPPEVSSQLRSTLHEHGIEQIFLLTQTSTEQRTIDILKISKGYVYYVLLNGTTGATLNAESAIHESVLKIRTRTDLPIVAGFGIRDAKTAVAVSRECDGIVIGSKLIEIINDSNPQDCIVTAANFISGIRTALDGESPSSVNL